LESSYYTSSNTKFPLRWTAKEVIQYKKFSSKSDVWAFGVVLWELMTRGQLPYPGMTNEAVIDGILNQHYRMPSPPGCPPGVHEMMLKCWAEVPADRAPFPEIASTLMDILDALPNEDEDHPAIPHTSSDRKSSGSVYRPPETN